MFGIGTSVEGRAPADGSGLARAAARRFHNLPLRIKGSAAAAVLLICLLAVGANAYLTSTRSAAGLRTLSQDMAAKQQAFSRVTAAVVATHMEIFRYVSWASNGVSQKLLDRLYAQIQQDLFSLSDRIALLAGRSDLSGQERASLQRLMAKWKNAKSKAQDTIEVGRTEPAMATLLLSETDDSFEAVDSDLKQMSLAVTAAADRLSETLYRNAQQNKLIVIIATIIGFLVSALVAILVGGSIVAPIRSITDVMRRLSGGETDVAIGHRDRRDEIGTMAEAIDLFQRNISEKHAEIRAARDAAEKALGELRATQQQLVVQQKMAALGQLTAGIAHEIKNPLNFVNNFADLSIELLAELKAAAAPAIGALDEAARAEIGETMQMLSSNLEKIADHGRRADGIVRSMLAHSRGSSGDFQVADLNALVEEALNLAYHGARAQDQDFNITLAREFDRALQPIEVVPQDVTRVLLNLISNGFYATAKRSCRSDGDGFRPLLKVTTRDLGEAVEIRIRDNGTGIAPEHRERLFQPFFTTKPTGEGTGLGLSISYEIITQQHGGTIAVDSEVGEFTEFRVNLPRRNRQGRRA
jgi:signal transduction histidine kinase